VTRITPLLRELPGGLKLAFTAMRFSKDPLIKVFLEKYDSIPKGDRRRRLSVEAIALAAKVDPVHLLGEIMLAVREHDNVKFKLFAVSRHSEIIKHRFAIAATPGGYRDRDAIDMMLGALPSPKGPTFISKYFAGGAKDADEPKDVPAEELVDDLDFVFPDASEMQERVQPIRQKLLETRK